LKSVRLVVMSQSRCAACSVGCEGMAAGAGVSLKPQHGQATGIISACVLQTLLRQLFSCCRWCWKCQLLTAGFSMCLCKQAPGSPPHLLTPDAVEFAS
jgi:hypothetical protein